MLAPWSASGSTVSRMRVRRLTPSKISNEAAAPQRLEAGVECVGWLDTAMTHLRLAYWRALLEAQSRETSCHVTIAAVPK